MIKQNHLNIMKILKKINKNDKKEKKEQLINSYYSRKKKDE